MLKQLLTTTALVSIGLTAQADQRNWSGFSLGAEGGYMTSRVPNKIKAGTDWQKQTTLGSEGVSLGLKAGGSYHFADRLLAGLDLDLSFVNAQYAEKAGAYKTSYNQHLSYGVSGKLGYVCDKIMTYLKAGVEFGMFRQTASGKVTVTVPPVGAGRVPTQKEVGKFEKLGNTHPGFTMGIGMEYAVSDNLILGGEFKHTLYKAKKYVGSNSKNFLKETMELAPRASKFLLTAKYKF